MRTEEIEMLLSERLCKSCPNAKKCHDECEYCDEFLDQFEVLNEIEGDK